MYVISKKKKFYFIDSNGQKFHAFVYLNCDLHFKKIFYFVLGKLKLSSAKIFIGFSVETRRGT